jgi:Spy/CpxP family protein refolding chaperone
MKTVSLTTIRTVTMIGVAALLLTSAVMAQTPFGVLTTPTAPDPATVVADHVARLTRLLTLTTAQAAQATTIFTNALAAVTPLETSLDADYTSIEAAVKSDATATIDSLSASVGTLTGQIVDIQNKADAAFYAILTSAQQTIFNSRSGLGGRGDSGRGGPRH